MVCVGGFAAEPGGAVRTLGAMLVLPVVNEGSFGRGDSAFAVAPAVLVLAVEEGLLFEALLPAPRFAPAVRLLLTLPTDPQYEATGMLRASLAESSATWKRLHRSAMICCTKVVWIRMNFSMRLSHILSATRSASCAYSDTRGLPIMVTSAFSTSIWVWMTSPLFGVPVLLLSLLSGLCDEPDRFLCDVIR